MKFIQHLNGKTWQSVIDRKWWPNQKKAVEIAGKRHPSAVWTGRRRTAMIA